MGVRHLIRNLERVGGRLPFITTTTDKENKYQHAYKNYGERVGNHNDEIEMIVDLTENNANIGYIVNNKNYGNVYDNIDKNSNYRLAVYFYYPSYDTDNDAKIQLL